MQLLASLRAGQAAPPCSGGVATALPLLLCPTAEPQWQDLEQLLQAVQAPTWADFLQCFVLNNSPHSRWGRGIRCTSLSSRGPGKIFLRVEVAFPQVFSSCFVQSCNSLSRNSNRSKRRPEFCLEYLSSGRDGLYLAINWTREVIASLGSIKAWASFSSMLRRDNNRSCSTTLSNVAPVARF